MKERKVPLFCWSFQRATRSNTPAIYSAVNHYLSYVSRQHGPCLVGYTLHCYIRSSNWHRSWQLVGIFLRLVTTEQKNCTERHQWRFGCILLSTLLALVSWNEPAKLQRENIQRVVKTPLPIPKSFKTDQINFEFPNDLVLLCIIKIAYVTSKFFPLVSLKFVTSSFRRILRMILMMPRWPTLRCWLPRNYWMMTLRKR